MEALRWGLIGCGDISRNRIAPAINALEHCELQAVNRRNSTLAESFANEFGAAKWYENWEDLLADKDIDAVYIATPVYLHAEQSIAAAKAGKHVLCEKPMALNSADCKRMIDACQTHNVALGIAYYRRFYPVVARLKEIMCSGEIGEPVIAEMQAFDWFDRKPGEPRSWLLDKEQAGGGPMMDFGCHRIEVMQSLFGSIDEVQSQVFNSHFKRDVEDTAYVSLFFKNRTHAIIRVSHAVYESRDTLEICGTKGSIRVPVLNTGSLVVTTEKGERTEHHPSNKNTHYPLIEDFEQAVREKRSPIVDGIAGSEVTRVLDHIYADSNG